MGDKVVSTAVFDDILELDTMIEEFKTEIDGMLDGAIGNRSQTKHIIKIARRKAALLQHKCRLEEDWELVGDIRAYLKSIRTLEFGLKGNRG